MSSFIESVKYSDIVKKMGTHQHSSHQIIFVVEGGVDICINEKSYALEQGSLIFISKTESHSIKITNSEYKRYELRILPTFLSSLSKNYRLYSILLNRSESFERVLKMPLEKTKAIFEKLKEEYESDSDYRQEMLSLVTDMLFISIYRLYPQLYSDTKQPYFDIAYKLQRQFEESLSYNYTLESLSSEYHISKFYLSHIFKSVTGYSVMDYLKNLRFAKAKNLLTESAMPISEIISICGFTDASNFSREFKKNTGHTPLQYRKKYAAIS